MNALLRPNGNLSRSEPVSLTQELQYSTEQDSQPPSERRLTMMSSTGFLILAFGGFLVLYTTLVITYIKNLWRLSQDEKAILLLRDTELREREMYSSILTALPEEVMASFNSNGDSSTPLSQDQNSGIPLESPTVTKIPFEEHLPLNDDSPQVEIADEVDSALKEPPNEHFDEISIAGLLSQGDFVANEQKEKVAILANELEEEEEEIYTRPHLDEVQHTFTSLSACSDIASRANPSELSSEELNIYVSTNF